MHMIRPASLRLTFLIALLAFASDGRVTSLAHNSVDPTPQTQSRKMNSWLDFDFDAKAQMGDAKNPAVILPAEMAALLGDVVGSKQVGETVFVPAAEFQRVASQPLALALLAPVPNQMSNVKSFDGFSAIDMTGLIKNLPSEFSEAPDAIGRRVTGENPEANLKLLQNGDIVLGSHLVNFMTWGRFNHVAVVVDATRGLLAESTASLPTDQPGVRIIDWKTFVAAYTHVGIVRVKRASPEQMSRVVRWLEERKGRPYRWPLIQGLDKADQSRFYCSQLVWLAYKEVLNLDLDVDKGTLVFPDDIYYSKEYVDVIVP